MVEDSTKNMRAAKAKALGMQTILVVGRGGGGGGRTATPMAVNAEARDNNSPDKMDPAVDAAVEVASEVLDVLEMWLGP